MSGGEDYIRLHITCPGWILGRRSLLDRPLGDDLYELRSTARYARHLNFLDVVRATDIADIVAMLAGAHAYAEEANDRFQIVDGEPSAEMRGS